MAIIHGTDEILRKHGMKFDGDIIRLRIMCADGDVESRKRQLKDIVQEGKTGRTKELKIGSKSKAKKKGPLKKVVYLKWDHYDRKKKKFSLVRTERGGGKHNEYFLLSATYDDVMERCMDVFWRRRKYPEAFGRESSINFYLVDAKRDVIDKMITDKYNQQVPFTIERFMENNTLARCSIIFRTKDKTFHFIDLLSNPLSDDDDMNDFEVPSTYFATQTSAQPLSLRSTLPPLSISADTSTPVTSSFIADTGGSPLPLSFILPDSSTPISPALIGDSSTRQELRNEIDRAFQESLEIDRRKECERIAAEERLSTLNELKEIRKSRVPAEPSLSEDHVTITIRHPTEGAKTRLFSAHSKMVGVYDWAGSLAPEPEYYEIVNYNAKIFLPEDTVESGVYNMRECEQPVAMTYNGTVAFAGFGVNNNNSSNESIDLEPLELPDENYALLQNARLVAVQSALTDDQTIVVNRDNIYWDMINYFSTNDFDSKRKVHIRFSNEDAVGDGVTRDALTLFFEKVYFKFEGCFEKVPTPTIESDELVSIGRIITTGFVYYNVFPFRIAHGSLKYALYNDITDEELFESFLNYVTAKEASLIRSYAQGRSVKTQAFIDIFSESRIYEQPSKENIYKLCIKAARITLVKMPSFSFKDIVSGMGAFWNNVTSEMMDSIRSMTNATPGRIMKALDVIENNNTEQRITTWLHRFIRSAEKDTLHQFVRFITGSANLIPHDIIKVEYVDQQQEYVRPIAETCFKILKLPRQYVSFSHLSENILYFLNNEDLWVVSDTPVFGIDP